MCTAHIAISNIWKLRPFSRISALSTETNVHENTHQIEHSFFIHWNLWTNSEAAIDIQTSPLTIQTNKFSWLKPVVLVMRFQKPSKKYAMLKRVQQNEVTTGSNLFLKPPLAFAGLFLIRFESNDTQKTHRKNTLTMSIMHLWLEKEAKLKSPWQLQEKLSANQVQEWVQNLYVKVWKLKDMICILGPLSLIFQSCIWRLVCPEK